MPCLAEAGAIVAMSARRAEWVAWLVETAEAQGGKALAMPRDMSKEADARAAVAGPSRRSAASTSSSTRPA